MSEVEKSQEEQENTKPESDEKDPSSKKIDIDSKEEKQEATTVSVDETNTDRKKPTDPATSGGEKRALEEKEEDPKDGEPKEGDAAAAAIPKRPVKRARTAYFIFADDKRAQVQKEHVGGGVAVVGKALGQLWATLTTEEKQKYQEQAAAERERVARDVAAWEKAHGGSLKADDLAQQNKASNDPGALAYPSARIRKICKLDPEVRGLSKEALLLITKAAELATAKLGIEAVRMTQLQNRRKLLPDDVAMVCRMREPFFFLKQDVCDLVKEQKEASQPQQSSKKKADAPVTSNPITSYFAPKNKKD